MESSKIKDELNQLVKEIYSKYDASGTGFLTGDKQKQFKEDFILNDLEANTFQGFQGKFWKEFKNIDYFVGILATTEASSLTKKTITCRVNNDDTKVSKSLIDISYIFQSEKRQTLLNDISPNLLLDADETFIYLKIFCDKPSTVKEPLDNILKLSIILGKTFLPKATVISHLKYEFSLSDDFILVKFWVVHPFLEMFHESLIILTKYLQHLDAKAIINIESTSDFEDLIDNKGDDLLKTFINGSKVNLNLMTNCYNPISTLLYEELKPTKMTKFLLTLLSLLDFNADLSLKMGDIEKNIFWNKLPEIKLFSTDNEQVKFIVQKFNQFCADLPIFKKLLDLFESMRGKFELSLNSPLGLIRVKLETSGLLEVWGLLKTIHY
jgi:hypothetical protein